MANVLVLGATSAIASEIAKIHAARGDALAIVGRDPDKLAALSASLGASAVFAETADFTDTAGNGARIDRALAPLGGSFDVALVAHGWLGDQLESERDVAHAEAVIAANFTSVVSLVVPLAERLEKQGKGSLVVIGSVAGDRGRPRNYTYGAAKGAVALYLQGVRTRLKKSAPAARVVTIRLGPVDTPMTTTHDKNALFTTARRAALGIVAAETRGAEDAYVPGYWRAIMAVVRNLPEIVVQRVGSLSGR